MMNLSSEYKVRLEDNGVNKQTGIDYGDTFSHVVKLANNCTALSVVLSKSLCLCKLGVKKIHCNLNKTMYMH